MDISGVGAFTAFGAGIVSFLSPCVLPIVPGYLSYIAGGNSAAGDAAAFRRLKALGLSAFFVAGFSTVFLALGATASVLGQLLIRYRNEANMVGGAIIIAFGLLMLGMSRWLPWLQRDMRFNPRVLGGHPGSAYLMGLAFGFGWTPCIGPVLGAILTFAAAGGDGTSAWALLGAYALGLGVPFVISALFLDRAASLLGRARNTGRILQIAGGLVLVVLGIAMMTGRLTAFSLWLLKTFPVLGVIG
jgi:cytochrome c-type biogenesis protein